VVLFFETSATFAVKGDVITDLVESMAAEQKARTTYDNILRLSDDPDVNNVIRFLREREIVHFQRFGEAKRELSSKIRTLRNSYNRSLLKIRCMKMRSTSHQDAVLSSILILLFHHFVKPN